MKRIKHFFAVIAAASAIAVLMSSCWGWYDWDEPYHRPHHPHHHHGPGPGPGPRY